MDGGYSWLGLLIDSSFASRFRINRDGNIVFANRAAHALFGYSDNELAGKPIDMIFARRDRETAVPRMPSFSSRMVGDDGGIKGKNKERRRANIARRNRSNRHAWRILFVRHHL